MKRNMKVTLGIVGITVSLALAAQNRDLLTGQRINYDQVTGNTTIENARIAPDTNFVLTARSASFVVDANETPRAIDLSGDVKFQIDGKRGTADRGTFYPELNLMSSSQITLFGDQSPSAAVSYTCQAGTLYANGASTGGGSVCSGFTEIGCYGAGGNSVYIVRRKYACSGS